MSSCESVGSSIHQSATKQSDTQCVGQGTADSRRGTISSDPVVTSKGKWTLSQEICLQGFQSGPEIIKLFSYSTQLSTKFILLINVKIPTSVGILTFISMINTTSDDKIK